MREPPRGPSDRSSGGWASASAADPDGTSPGALELTSIADREPLTPSRHPVPLERREGVFMHLYRCRVCQVKWAVFSWLADPAELRAGRTTCPWCHAATPVIHERETVSEARQFRTEHVESEIKGIIERLAPAASLMADSQLAPFDAYAGDPADRD